MNVNPIRTEIFEADAPAESVIGASTLQAQSAPADDAEDMALCKSTLMIDMPAGSPEKSGYSPTIEPNLKYVLGMAQGQRAYLLTNLQEESQLLFQPQMAWTIGRNRDAALPLQDRAMSRRHAVILYVQTEGFQLIDLNSMNGSFINSVRIQQRGTLKDGDRIRLGGTDFTFFFSRQHRTVDPIHPEVLSRFSASRLQTGDFVDYAAFDQSEIGYSQGW